MTANSKSHGPSMSELYNKRDTTGDITFIVGSERTMAHRCVLAVQSPKYEAQFFGPNPDRDEIRIPNVSAGAFNVFLQFFYQPTIDLTMENIEAVLDLAKQSLVDEFVADCVRFLTLKATPQNVCWAYDLALKYSLESLRNHCERQIQYNSKQLFTSDDFLHCDHKILLDILKMDSLNCSEMDVFNACIAWAREHCKQNNLDDGIPTNLRAALGDVIHQIRFTSINAKEVAALHNSLPGFFTNEETKELFYMVNQLDGFASEKFNQKPRSASVRQHTPHQILPVAVLCGPHNTTAGQIRLNDSFEFDDQDDDLFVHDPFDSPDSDSFGHDPFHEF